MFFSQKTEEKRHFLFLLYLLNFIYATNNKRNDVDA